MITLIEYSDGRRVTPSQFRAENSRFVYSGTLPTAAALGSIGASVVKTAPNMAQMRAQASLDRTDFQEALFDAGIITEAELLAWAGGQVPASVDTDLSNALSGSDLVKARARVMSAQTINRMHDLVLLLQAARSLTDEQVDALFGIS